MRIFVEQGDGAAFLREFVNYWHLDITGVAYDDCRERQKNFG